MIILKPRGTAFPVEEHLLKSELRNADGIGIAYSKDKKVFIKKDFTDATQCYKWMIDNLTVDSAVIIHQRFGTSGLTDEGNRHPFPCTTDKELMRKVEQECKVAFAHNGVFYGHSTDKVYSDTMLVLSKYFGTIGSLAFSNECVRELILEFVGTTNRICFLNSAGKFSIFGSGWIEHPNGCIYSNKGFEYTAPAPVTTPIGFNQSTPFANRRMTQKRLPKANGLPHFGKPPEGQPKKKFTCDVCGASKKSKWRGDLEKYVCSKCYKAEHLNDTIDTPSVDYYATICAYCSNKEGKYRLDISKHACNKCYANELWFRAKCKEFDELGDKLSQPDVNN